MKTLNDLTLFDLMAEDFSVWISKVNECGFKLEIDNEDGESVVEEKCVHSCAADGFAVFCRQYLAAYDKASVQEV